MTNPQVRYIIIGDSELAKETNRTLPSGLNKEFYKSIQTIENKNNYKVRFAFFGNDNINNDVLKNLKNMRDADVTAVKIIGDNEESGTLEFYQKDDDKWSSPVTSYYLTKSSLIGAIYADTLETYECNIKSAFSRANLVTEIYMNRASNLIQEGTEDDRQLQCNGFYNTANSDLNTISTASSNLVSEINQGYINAILSAFESLVTQNKNLQLNSCTLLY